MIRLAIGVDIGGTRTKIGLVNISTGSVLHTVIRSTETKEEEGFLNNIGAAIKELSGIAENLKGTIEGIGFGVPGYVYGNVIVDSTYGFLEFMEDYPLKAIVEKKFQFPCLVDNDARVVALGEAFYGKGTGFERVLVLTLGTGLGFGFVVNGKFPDAYPLSHMGGHVSLTGNGEECYCGKKGCLEALVSSQGVINAGNKINWAKKYPEIPLTAEAIFEAATTGNHYAIKIVEDLINHLHKGIHNYVNLFAPDVIVLGGGISKGLIPYVDQLNRSNFLKPYKNYQVQIAISALEEGAGILGAAALFSMRTQLNVV